MLSILAGCSGLPQKPNVVICVLDEPAREAICGIRGEEPQRVPLETMDKAIAFRPDQWEELIIYYQFLEVFSKDCAKRCK